MGLRTIFGFMAARGDSRKIPRGVYCDTGGGGCYVNGYNGDCVIA